MNQKTLLFGTVTLGMMVLIGYGYLQYSPMPTHTTLVATTSPAGVPSFSDAATNTAIVTPESSDIVTPTYEDVEAPPTPLVTPVKNPPVETVVDPVPAPASDVRVYTAAEVARHATETDCWTIINGNVYDLTSYVTKHPGGKSNILRICGTNGTAAFSGQHGGESRPENTLVNYKIGVVQ